MRRVALLLALCLLLPSVASAAVYYVDPSAGSDARSCTTAKAIATPKQTLASVLPCLTAAGDILFLRGGTYSEHLFETQFGATGTSWTLGSYITISGYSGETAILKPSGTVENIVRFQDASIHHVLIKDLVVDGSLVTLSASPGSGADIYTADTSHDLHFENVESRDAYGNCYLAAGSNHLFLNLTVHGCGRETNAAYGAGHQGFYGSAVNNSIIRGGSFYGNKCIGIRIGTSDPVHYTSDNNLVDGVLIYNNAVAAGGLEACPSLGGGILFSSVDNIAQNNIIYGNSDGVFTYTLSGNVPTRPKFYHNTITGNTQGVAFYGPAEFTTGPVNAVLQNNIIYNNTTNIIDHGTGTTQTTNQTTNPTFVDAAGHDYHLQSGSGARDAATAVSGIYVDYAKQARIRNTTPDIGAYEYNPTAVNFTPADATALTNLLAGTSSPGGNILTCGDTITLTANTTYTGNFTIRDLGCTGSTYTTITSSGSLPASGTRIGPGDQAQLGKIVTSNTAPALDFCFHANNWKLIGVEVASSKTDRVAETYNVILTGYDCDGGGVAARVSTNLPTNLIFDRVYVHGTTAGNVGKGIMLNARTASVLSSYINNIHVDYALDTNCILTYNGLGPYTIDNTYMSCAGEDFMAGGGGNPYIPNGILDGLTFTNNYLTKDCTWFANAADIGCTYAGTAWPVKNTFELKSAKNVTVDHNIIENSWVGSQDGSIVLFQAINQYGTGDTAQDGICTWCTISNVTFTNNIVRHGAIGMTLAGSPMLFNFVEGTSSQVPPITASTLTVSNNLFYDLHGAYAGGGAIDQYGGTCWAVGYSYTNVTINHNTCDQNHTGILLSNYHTVGATYTQLTNLHVTNNFFRGDPDATDNGLSPFTYGVKGDNSGSCTSAFTAYVTSGLSFLNNVIGANVSPADTCPATTDQPSATTFNATFTDRAIGHNDNAVDYSVVPSSVYKAGGAKEATDHTDVGVNTSLIPSETTTPPATPMLRIRRR